ncbi:MAG: hypothetical protein QOH69_1758 [Actinomycetota bacterium]|nr:hypothetical protein [Actinomycetota bacterium]
MLALKRARPRVALFLATFGVVFLLAALSVGLSGFLAGSATAGARAGLAALTGSSGGFRITIPLARDATAQDVRVHREIIDGVLSDGQRVPLRVLRDVETLAAVELDGPRGVVRSALASIPGLRGGADLVSGAWPADATQASIQADAAVALGVRVGDTLALPGGARVTIVGTWRAHNPSDPIWLGSALPLTGLGYGGVAGFVVIDPSLWAHSGTAPVARWTVLPQASRITAPQLAAIQRSPDTVPIALLADSRNGKSVDQDGRIQPAMNVIVSNVQAASAVSIAPLVIVGLLGVVTLIELARMLSQLRDGETRLLRARGATRQRLVLGAAVEAAIISVPAAVVGAALAAAVLPGVAHGTAVTAVGWTGVGLTALAAIGVLATSAGLSSPDEAQQRSESGDRIRSTVGIAAVALVVVVAIVAVSQFLLYGSPLTTTVAGGLGVDPLAVTAPALALAALSLIGLALFPLVSRAAERIAHGLVGLSALPVRQLARRDRAAITPILLVALAVAGLVFSATYSGTWQVSSAATRAVQVGTGVRVTGLSSPPSFEGRVIPGQRAAAPAGTADVQIGDSLVPMVELPVARIGDVVTPVSPAVDPHELARRLADAVARPQLPTGARGIVVSVVATPASAAPTDLEITVVDAVGTLTTLRGTRDRGSFTMQLPPGTAPWVVRAIDVQLLRAPENARVSIALHTTGDGRPIPLGNTWTLSDLGGGNPGFTALTGATTGVRVTAATDGARLRLQPRAEGGERLPIVISASLAKSAGLRVGGQIDMPLVGSGGDLLATVVGIAPVIPGLSSDDGVLADLGSVQDAVLRSGLNSTATSEWWIATDKPGEVSHWLTGRLPVGAVLETRDTVPADEVLGSANTVVWIAAIAIALLGMLAVAAGLAAEVRARNEQVALLRALGVGRRLQARGRAVEVGALLALGLLAGLIDGVIVSALIVPDLARTAVPGALAALPTVLALDALAGIGSLLAVVLVAGGILLATAAAVRRQAGLATSGEGRR